jgi:hypothetical protein
MIVGVLVEVKHQSYECYLMHASHAVLHNLDNIIIWILVRSLRSPSELNNFFNMASPLIACSNEKEATYNEKDLPIFEDGTIKMETIQLQ